MRTFYKLLALSTLAAVSDGDSIAHESSHYLRKTLTIQDCINIYNKIEKEEK